MHKVIESKILSLYKEKVKHERHFGRSETFAALWVLIHRGGPHRGYQFIFVIY